MTNVLERLGRFSARRPWVVIASWVVLAVVVVASSSAIGRHLDDAFGAPGLDSQRATDLLQSTGSASAGLTAEVVATPRESTTTFAGSAADRAALRQVAGAVAALPHVLATSGPVVSPDGRVALIRVQYPTIDQLSPRDLQNLTALQADLGRRGSPLQVELGGDLFFAFDQPTIGTGEVVGIVAAGVILLLAFGSLVAMGLPIGIAVFGLVLGVSSLSLVAYVVDIPSWVPVIGCMVGLGVGIDYALFLVTRHRENLARGDDVVESVANAVATAGRAVAFAGGTVVFAILGLATAGIPFLAAGGVGVSLIVLLMVLASLTLLPAFLGLTGRRVLGRRARRQADAPTGGRWERWGNS